MNQFSKKIASSKVNSYNGKVQQYKGNPETVIDDNFQSELEEKLEERKRSLDFQLSNNLIIVEKKQMRQFTRADEYLYAIKEDLAEWLNNMYPTIMINADNFIEKLETGEYLVKHANLVRHKKMELMNLTAQKLTKQKIPNFSVPEQELPVRSDVEAGSWFARDNVFNFIIFCRCIGVMECIMFETEDLVCRKNEKHVILTLLEVARRGAKLGIMAPMLVQFEQEIDWEIAREEQLSRNEKMHLMRPVSHPKNESASFLEMNAKQLSNEEMFDSLLVEIGNVDDQKCIFDDSVSKNFYNFSCDHVENFEGYEIPIGPMPQMVTNDLKSLDDMVRDVLSECQCPVQFAVIRVSEGKYRIGDTQTLIFVRILRTHVMVRVGGGWDTLQNYLDKHDPCRCKSGHKRISNAQIALKNDSNDSTSIEVNFERCNSAKKTSKSSSKNYSKFSRDNYSDYFASRKMPFDFFATNNDMKAGECVDQHRSQDNPCAISDEEYKSSDENSRKLFYARTLTKLTKSSTNNLSECSSTISSEEDLNLKSQECEKDESLSPFSSTISDEEWMLKKKNDDQILFIHSDEKSEVKHSKKSNSSFFSHEADKFRSHDEENFGKQFKFNTWSSAKQSGNKKTRPFLSFQSNSDFIYQKKPINQQLHESNSVERFCCDENLFLKKIEKIMKDKKTTDSYNPTSSTQELPTEIFKNFTSQWVNNQPSQQKHCFNTTIVKPSPSPRKSKLDSGKTKIPMPTFFA